MPPVRSLNENEAEDPQEVERAWEEEIRCRLAEVEAGTAELMVRGDLSLSARDALALLDQRIEDLVQGMQMDEARAAAAKAFATPPRVRIGAASARESASRQR